MKIYTVFGEVKGAEPLCHLAVNGSDSLAIHQNHGLTLLAADEIT